jgi:hypothetical protein
MHFSKRKPISILLETVVNSRKPSKMKYNEQAPLYLELDIWIPEYDLCFEFQVRKKKIRENINNMLFTQFIHLIMSTLPKLKIF